MVRILWVLLTCVIFLAGCGKEQFELGSDLRDGRIAKKTLRFTFKKYKGNGTVQDLINFLYFEGDTLCFSFVPEGSYDKKQVTAWIIDQATGKESPVERLDFYPDKIAGFSLVGSVLEDFHRNQLNKPAPHENFCCRNIPVIVKVKVGGKEYTKQGAFRIEYAH